MNEGLHTILEQAEVNTFHIISLLLFLCAVVHVFFTSQFSKWSNHLAARHSRQRKKDPTLEKVSFGAELLQFLGEIELVFAIWAVPLAISIVCFYDWKTLLKYLNTRDYVEPLFVVVIMALAASRPIVNIAEKGVERIARIFGDTPASWWLTILILIPLLGSFLTEAGAMTIAAILLMRKFFILKPSKSLKYATIALLFTNVSVGGMLTTFASPSVLIIARKWNWDTLFMLSTFGWKAMVGVVLASSLYYFIFRKEFANLGRIEAFYHLFVKQEKQAPPPLWITIIHILFVVWVVFTSHYPPVFMGSFLLYLGFHQATRSHTSFSFRLSAPFSSVSSWQAL